MWKRKALLVLLAFLLCPALSSAALAAEESSWPSHLRLLTGPNGGQWFSLGAPLAEVLTRNILPTTSRMGGGAANIEQVDKKLADLGFTMSCFLGAGESGEAEYQALQSKNAVLMANVYPQVLYVLLRRDFAEEYGIRSLDDLLSKRMPLRFASLRPGTASEFILGQLLRHGYGSSFDKLREQGWLISFNNYSETADNFVSGQLDGFAYTAGPDVPLIKIMEEHTDIVFLPIRREVLDSLSAKFKTSSYVIQPGDYKNVSEPVETLGSYTSLLVRKDLPESLVYAICECLWDNRAYISEIISDFGRISPDSALSGGLAAHPGAEHFWNNLKNKQR
ncbi:TAXI family TRAP transporter solute-binding subunit [Desulfovibrio sp. OttesenSCG-928-C14]|nr:TAXI family TRAP transporter solute-binding subunit [Desulfovibrio sp. OttesenSCG-928-C14]